jgi:uncharacterized protein YwqG
MDPVWMGTVHLSIPDRDPDEALSEFRLLAQFSSDQDANVEFADAGIVYFVMLVDDLAAGNYSRVACFLESH